MSQSYIGEVRLVGFNFAPVYWAQCQGQLVSISENPALFQLIGTTYGGDGQNTFGLPNLQSRVTVHTGSNGSSSYVIGQTGGVENVTLNQNQYPAHSHTFNASSGNGGSNSPVGNTIGALNNSYSSLAPANAMNPSTLAMNGGAGSNPHTNVQPYLAMNWIIALFGVFPTQG